MLAVPSEPFNSKEYIFEVKWDGFRCLSYLGEITVLQSRNRNNFSGKFPELNGLHKMVKCRPVIVDGEIIIMDDGTPSFYELQKRGWSREPSAIARAASSKPATYVVFDILYAGNDKLMNLPLTDRQSLLRQFIETDERMFISEGIYEQGIEFYRACIERDLEGVVAKKLDSPYVPGKRSPSWKKFKKFLTGEFIICGYKQTHQDVKRVDSLLLGCPADGKLVFQGTVGVGLGGITGQRLYSILSPLRTDQALFKVSREVTRGFIWVRPGICCTVEFLEPARDGGLRHPVFRGLREDIDPQDCTGIAGATAGS